MFAKLPFHKNLPYRRHIRCYQIQVLVCINLRRSSLRAYSQHALCCTNVPAFSLCKISKVLFKLSLPQLKTDTWDPTQTLLLSIPLTEQGKQPIRVLTPLKYKPHNVFLCQNQLHGYIKHEQFPMNGRAIFLSQNQLN